jgi:hypothetical protein
MRRRFTLASIVCGALFGMTVLSSSLIGQENSGQSEVQRGFEIAPVTLNLKGLSRGLVGEGSYYVNGISVCAGCHTGESGYLGGGVPFGPVLSRNLTPDAAGLPAGLTFTEFEQAIRLGTDFKGLFPPGPLIVMPWQEYRYGTDRFIRAIYEYLKAVPCVEGGPGQPANRC